MNKSSRLQLQSFDHQTLVVANVDASRNFYVGILGMDEVPRPAFDFPGAWFQIGAFQIHVTQADENSGLAGWGDRKVKRISRGHHFAFQVDDVEQAIQTLEQHSISVLSGPRVRPDGPIQICIADPDGHLIELFSK